MQAVMVRKNGGPSVLEVEERSSLRGGPGDIVVALVAAGVNFADVYAREGRAPYAGHLPFVPGLEGAGVVSLVGSEVTEFRQGDRVAWAGVAGAYAEEAVVPADRAVPVPDDLDLESAAAIMLQGLTAHYLSQSTYQVAADEVAVVHAAAGGVGLLLTQMVAKRGGVVVATTSSVEKAELATRAGARHVAGYDNFGDTVTQVSGGAGAAVVYDGVGASTFDASLASLRPLGYLVLYGGASGPVPPFDLQRLAAGGSLYITRPTLASYISRRQDLLRRTGDLFRWVADGELAVRIGGTYPLENARQAHEDLEARRTTGKLLLLPGRR